MNLEKQVTSLELSKRLKELGVRQESLFYWLKWLNSPLEMNLGYKDTILSNNNSFFNDNNYKYYSAFTAAELLALLPVGVHTDNYDPFGNYRILIWKSLIVPDTKDMKIIDGYSINYECDTHLATDKPWDRKYLTKNQWDENPANAMAKMLIYLYESGLMKND